MFLRFQAMKERRESGFTLIELLVVILIIAILAAIAIPVFLNQRKKGWVSQLESASKNAATAAESYATGQASGNYAGLTEAGLVSEGWKKAIAVTVATGGINVSADNNKYCISLQHSSITGAKYMSISSDLTAPTKTTTVCSAGTVTAGDWSP